MTLTEPRARIDRELQEDVLAEINRDRRFKPAEVGVEVDDGVVTLTGTVSSFAKIGWAAQIAADLAGVKDVANKLTVELPDSWKRDDTKIASIVRDALIFDADVPEERIDSIVRKGIVTLRGTVDAWYQRQRAAEVVENLTGVLSVDNQITVAPTQRSDQELHDDIKAALRRREALDDIDVAVDGGVVTLMGRVRSYSDKMEAEDLARTTAGVKSVLNKIIAAPL